MKTLSQTFLLLIAALLIFPALSQAQSVGIAVVDMQEAVNKYYKTAIEIKKVDDLASAERKALEEQKASMDSLQKQMTGLDKTRRATELAESKRKEADSKLQALQKQLSAKAKEFEENRQKSAEKVVQSRATMEETLVKEVKAAVDALVAAQGHDLVFDKSFLPKANKAILYTSQNVKDLTAEVIASLNVNAPN